MSSAKGPLLILTIAHMKIGRVMSGGEVCQKLIAPCHQDSGKQEPNFEIQVTY